MHPRQKSALLAPLSVLSILAACGGGTSGADLSEELTGGDGPFVAASGGAVPEGYELHEYVAEGTATEYRATDAGLPNDGLWTLERASKAHYRTRIVVRRPSDVANASGTVVVEWLNVSGGVDADAEYATLAEEIVRQGHIWVGVSAQSIGVEGGPVLVGTGMDGGVAGQGLKAIDEARYGSLVHPGDAYAFDIFTQVALALREGGEALGGLRPDIIIAAGESQSAMALTTYYDGIQPMARAFDAFFIHSRGAFTLPFVPPGKPADLLSALTKPERPILRQDIPYPAMVIQAESDTVDLLSSSLVRQPDSDTVRLWEVAGTAHADRHLLGANADLIDCGGPVNDGPMHIVSKAAFRALDVWVRTGEAPPIAPRIEVDTSGAEPLVVRDADAIALGGIRTPLVDVPVDVLSGEPVSESIICKLFGSTVPLSDTRLAELYASRAVYEAEYAAATDASIAAGFVLAEDRAALIAYAQPSRVAP